MEHTDYTIRLPAHVAGLAQHEEYFILVQDGQERSIRMHDYDTIYTVPGLYQRVTADVLHCDSPNVLTALLADQLSRAQVDPADLSILDLGAGVGLIGVALRQKGIPRVIGIDIVPAARVAAERDHPGIYTHYFIEDVTNLSDATRATLAASELNGMVCASALGLHHVPPTAFAAAFNLIRENGWVLFNVNQQALESPTPTGFAAFVQHLIAAGILEVMVRHPYRHRLSVAGSPIMYVAMVGRKRAAVPPTLLAT